MIGAMRCGFIPFRRCAVIRRRPVPRIHDPVFQALFQGTEAGVGAGVQEADVTDFLEAFGEHMLQKTAEEVQGRQGHGPPAGLVRLIAEGDGAVLHAQQPPVRQGDPVEIGGQVFQSRLTIADRLAVDGPGGGPGLGWGLAEQRGVGGLEGVAKFGPEHLP